MDNYLLNSDNDIIPYAENLLRTNINLNELSELSFLPSYLTKNIGKWMKVEHLIGGSLISHIGQLISTGVDYIVLKLESDTVTTVVCNMKDIRFITIIYDRNIKSLK